MKTVIFVCLLSLSMCLSVPTTNSDLQAPTQQAATGTQTQAPPKPDENATKENITTNAAPIIKTLPQNEAPNPPKTTPSLVNNTTEDKNGKVDKDKATDNSTAVKPITEKTPETTPKPIPADNKSDNKAAPADNKTPADDKANNTVVPAKKEEATTIVPSKAVSPPVAPNVTEKPVVLARGFDGASFVGGIILTLGLLAIGFMGFKYYKNQTERNYHTL